MYPKVIKRDVVNARDVIEVQDYSANELSTETRTSKAKTGWEIAKMIFGALRTLWSALLWLILKACKAIGWVFRFVFKEEMTNGKRRGISFFVAAFNFALYADWNNDLSILLTAVFSSSWFFFLNKTIKAERNDWLIGGFLAVLAATALLGLAMSTNSLHPMKYLSAAREGGMFTLPVVAVLYAFVVRKKIVPRAARKVINI